MKVEVTKGGRAETPQTIVKLTLSPAEVDGVLQGGSLSDRAQAAIVDCLKEHRQSGRNSSRLTPA